MAQIDFSRVAQAMSSVSIAASSSLGKDCATHAAHCQALLRRLGLETRYVIGYAGWRVGPKDGDLLIHHPAHVHSVGENAAVYHAWLEIGNPESRHRWIIDFTTYQIPIKLAELDALDGIQSSVTWAPEFLLIQAAETFPLARVIQEKAGMSYYEANLSLERKLLETAKPLDEEDAMVIWMKYQNPEMRVIGPNDFA